MQVTSEALEDGARMPGRFATERGGGRNVSPPLAWSDAPEGTRSFVVTVIDRHPAANDWIHWAVVDVPPDVTSLPEGSSGSVPGGRELVNTFGTRGWGGPQPPPGRGPHRYEVSVRALSVPELDVPERPSAEDLEGEMEGVVLASGALTVAYER
ncbi:MAG: YbhB/YbcL family Raf kinase inhibitor-like protein [Coriobacteriia bacterium]|nr:YbhB/YbcL family Raf kinase inhibitor-like protein [Coriobacteriia bacterium]